MVDSIQHVVKGLGCSLMSCQHHLRAVRTEYSMKHVRLAYHTHGINDGASMMKGVCMSLLFRRFLTVE